MKKIIALIISFYFFLPAHAQVQDTLLIQQEVDSLIQLSKTYLQAKKFDEAVTTMVQAQKTAEDRLGLYHSNNEKALFVLARTYQAINKLKEAEATYKKVIEINTKMFGKESSQVGRSMANLGNVLSQAGQFESAEPIYLEAIEILEKTLGRDHPDFTPSLNHLAVLYARWGKHDRAEPYFLEIKEIRGKYLGKDHPLYAASLANLSLIYNSTDRFERAEAIQMETLDILEKQVGNAHPNYAKGLSILASIRKNLGQYRAAEQLFLDALKIFEKAPGKQSFDYAIPLYNLATLYQSKGRYATAEAYQFEALEIFEPIIGKQHPTYIRGLGNLALLYQSMKQYQRAEEVYLETLALGEKVMGKNNVDYIRVLSNLGSMYTSDGQLEKAEALLTESKTLLEAANGVSKAQGLYARILMLLGELYTQQEQYELAENLLFESIQIEEKIYGSQHADLSYNHAELAKLYWRDRQFSRAGKHLGKVVDIQKLAIQNGTQFLSENELGDLRKIYEKYLHMNYAYGQMLQGSGYNHAGICYDNALFHKGLLLNTSVEVRNQAIRDSTARDLIKQYQSYHRRLARILYKPVSRRAGIDELKAQANDIERQLVQRVSGFAHTFAETDWSTVQAQLGPGEAAVELVHYPFYNPYPTDSVFYAALVLQPGKKAPDFVPLFEEGQLADLWPDAASNPDGQALSLYETRGVKKRRKKQAPSLYALIWEPLDSLLGEVQKVYIAPTGLLHRVAFHAIPVTKKVLLRDKYQLALLSSTRNLVLQKEHNAHLKSAVVYGGLRYTPDSTGMLQPKGGEANTDQQLAGQLPDPAQRAAVARSWTYLPGTLQELKSVQRLFKMHDIPIQTYEGYQGSEAAFKALGTDQPSPSILHLATHGFFFPDEKNAPEGESEGGGSFRYSDNPLMRSGLILAGANPAWQGLDRSANEEDGILTAYEIANTNLSQTQLVVLSACDTGLGDIRGTEGVFGLQRAFKKAGLDYIIMSLWPVPDEPTAELMERFYQLWLSGADIGEAFDQAQQAMRRQYQDPYYWAGFVMIR